MTKKFIKDAIKHHGALHLQLNIPRDEPIPTSLLQMIVRSKSGQTISNPTNSGLKRIRITLLMKRRAQFALNIR